MRKPLQAITSLTVGGNSISGNVCFRLQNSEGKL